VLERADELLVQRVTEGLDPAETAELEQLLGQHPDLDGEALERAAAAISIAALRNIEPMPAALRARIMAANVLPPRASGGTVSSLRPARTAQAWPWLAAAAALVLAVIGWWPNAPTAVPLAEQRAELLAAGAQQLAWKATEDPAAAGASGDVVWDPRTQQGFMRISALARNEPTRFQYQLWIFDAARDERYPVDGGVFDIPAEAGEVLVPIHAKLPVSNAVLFAVTVEAPGGVVVSGRERIVLLAQLG
jgi:hypothetical protein